MVGGWRRGLPPDVVDAWRARIGADDPAGDNTTHYVRRTGRDGLINRHPELSVSATIPDGFDEIFCWRALTDLLVYVALRTPCTVSRSTEAVANHPWPFLVFATTTPPGGRFCQGAETVVNDSRDSVLVYDNNQGYSHTTNRISDEAGIWVPTRLLGNELGSSHRLAAPILSDTPLARAAAAFIRNFANDVAARGVNVDPSSELAAVDLVRAVLTQRPHARTLSGVFNDSDSVRAATRDLIEQCFQDPEFRADEIARSLHMSRRQLYRHFTDTGQTPTTMITRRRLMRAVNC
ncbi:AraC family transcriptional regulator [Gordonia polyisoprenivorans]|uniref:AraC family transcriptional regulator n=1 Tax=Gordonia polyisoprenivorans TaxID=84595 RepID=UPI002301F8EE|nr:AraC family transcriptional regulator [Gordonia polyisoprenivorans]WCB35965.1 AraC family transcriptional regulator [Gordonia polyisoprenivorans]